VSWRNFQRSEFACKCGCGTNEIQDALIDVAQQIRDECGFALTVTSGYRCPNHPAERSKATPGTHSRGIAVDFGVMGGKARIVAKIALRKSIGGIGINQKGSGRFVHVDVDSTRTGLFWTY